jgi:hypothetical protein
MSGCTDEDDPTTHVYATGTVGYRGAVKLITGAVLGKDATETTWFVEL